MQLHDSYESPVGTLYLTGTPEALTGLSFCSTGSVGFPEAENGEFAPVKKWLDDYFRRIPSKPDFAMMPEGTTFQRLIWDLLMEIPWGETVTYGELARQAAVILGKEKMSAQAVGQAVGHNPIAIIIPCHRVLGAGGKLTGYAYGLERKMRLLRHEQRQEEL